MIIICPTVESITAFIQPDHSVRLTGIFIDHYKNCPVKTTYGSHIGCIYDCCVTAFFEVGSHIENCLTIKVIDSISIESGLIDSIAIELKTKIWIAGIIPGIGLIKSCFFYSCIRRNGKISTGPVHERCIPTTTGLVTGITL